MKRKYSKTLALIFHRPVSGNIKWKEIEAFLLSLGAEISNGKDRAWRYTSLEL
jgi:hypothetical protein